jgi:AraC-like DNA-binding protein
MGASSSVHELGTFGRLICQSLTLRDGLETACQIWSDWNSGVHVWVLRCGDYVDLHHRFLHGDPREWRQFVAATLMTYLNFLGAAAGPGWRPTAVGLPLRSLPGVRSIPLLADTRIEFGRPWMTLTFAAAVLSRPLRRLPAVGMRGTNTDWTDSTPAIDFGGAVQQIVTTLLPDGYPGLQLVAEAVRMSPRTLQRRLEAEGLTFARVVAKARVSEAQRMLGDPARKVIDVALDLGYSDPAHFTRAFERWTGVAPREFRRRAVEHADRVGS